MQKHSYFGHGLHERLAQSNSSTRTALRSIKDDLKQQGFSVRNTGSTGPSNPSCYTMLYRTLSVSLSGRKQEVIYALILVSRRSSTYSKSKISIRPDRWRGLVEQLYIILSSSGKRSTSGRIKQPKYPGDIFVISRKPALNRPPRLKREPLTYKIAQKGVITL